MLSRVVSPESTRRLFMPLAFPKRISVCILSPTIQVRPDGTPACTRYRRLLYKNGYSLVSLCLETGRTHQIRVHMKFIGHPLPGDFLYNPDYRILRRQALHSFRLSFRHPVTGKDMEFTAPLPSDMARAL